MMLGSPARQPVSEDVDANTSTPEQGCERDSSKDRACCEQAGIWPSKALSELGPAIKEENLRHLMAGTTFVAYAQIACACYRTTRPLRSLSAVRMEIVFLLTNLRYGPMQSWRE
jgi:hypothetical protein